MATKSLTELPLTTLHAARQACLTLLLDKHRIYLEGGLPMLAMIGGLRDDVGAQLGMEPLGKTTPVEPRGIGETTDAELKSMEWAAATLLDGCRAGIGDPALAEYLAGLQATIDGEKEERRNQRARFPSRPS
ncbi:MAG TPA: hypothetical protein VMU95_09575 [Trebonia sp.]|nr:hypothetical protein [Trebonia sp.]